MINQVTLNNMLQTGLLAITIPVVLIVAWKMFSKKSLVPFFAGMLVFIAFSRVMESIPHVFFLSLDNPASRFINAHAIIYAIYGGLMAGLFEEGGRYFAFRVLLGNHTGKETSVTYGIGHGGMECILVMGVTFIQYYAYGQLINSGKMDKMIAAYQADATKAVSIDGLNQLVDTVKEITPLTCYMADLERISAMMVQIALSILVFQAVRIDGKKFMFWVAVVLHMLMDIPAGLYQKGKLALIPTEIFLFVYAVGVLYYSIRVYSTMNVKGTSAEDETMKKHRLHQIANRRRAASDPEKKDS